MSRGIDVASQAQQPGLRQALGRARDADRGHRNTAVISNGRRYAAHTHFVLFVIGRVAACPDDRELFVQRRRIDDGPLRAPLQLRADDALDRHGGLKRYERLAFGSAMHRLAQPDARADAVDVLTLEEVDANEAAMVENR